jgi:hypothetical protein
MQSIDIKLEKVTTTTRWTLTYPNQYEIALTNNCGSRSGIDFDLYYDVLVPPDPSLKFTLENPSGTGSTTTPKLGECAAEATDRAPCMPVGLGEISALP